MHFNVEIFNNFIKYEDNRKYKDLLGPKIRTLNFSVSSREKTSMKLGIKGDFASKKNLIKNILIVYQDVYFYFFF